MDAVWDGRSDGFRYETGFGDRSTRRGNFGDEFEVRRSNQWGLGGATRPRFQITLGGVVIITGAAMQVSARETVVGATERCSIAIL